MDINKEFDALLDFQGEAEKIEHEAQMLAFQFLSQVDAYMSANKIRKKELAKKLGTSAAFITQLFRGDRKPSWNLLAKMQAELNLEFKVFTKDHFDQLIKNELEEYHNKWVRTKSYEKMKGFESSRAVMSITKETDYALAG